jgi:hypothetical protein
VVDIENSWVATMSFRLPPARDDRDGRFPDGTFFARLSRFERLGDGPNARSSLEFDAIEVEDPQKVSGWIRDARGAEERFGLVRMVTTPARFEDLVGVGPVEGRWYELRLSRRLASGPWTWFARLEDGGYTSLAAGSFLGGEPLASPDDGDVPPRPRSLGAAASSLRALPPAIATACRIPASSMAGRPDPLAILGSVGKAATVCVRDVGQASFVTLKSSTGECLLHFDVGSPVSFNRHTLPPQPGWSLRDPRHGQVAPVVLSHWDWDHLHAALQIPSLQQRPWIVPDQPLGPGAARLANALVKLGTLAIWPDGIAPFPWGVLARCTGKSGSNDSGLAALIRLPSKAVLLTGDAPYFAVPGLLQSSVDVLLSTHHGGRLVSSDQPPSPAPGQHAWIISCGRGNTYRHPHPKSLTDHGSAGWGVPIYTSNAGGQPRGDRTV